MITDQFNIFFEGELVDNKESSGVYIMPYAGRSAKAYLSIVTTQGYNPGSKLEFIIQEADEKDGEYTDLVKLEFKDHEDPGSLLSFRLPDNISKKFIRLKAEVTGATQGAVFAGLTMDTSQPYSPGQFVDKGQVMA